MLEIRADEIFPPGYTGGDLAAFERAGRKRRSRKVAAKTAAANASTLTHATELSEERGQHVIVPRPVLSASKIMFAEIETAALAHFGLTRAELWSRRQGVEISHRRQQIYWLAAKHTTLSFPEIGRRAGGRDHSTIISGIRRMNERISRGEPAPSWFTPRELTAPNDYAELLAKATSLVLARYGVKELRAYTSVSKHLVVRGEIWFTLARTYHVRLGDIARICGVEVETVSESIATLRAKRKRASASHAGDAL